MTIQAKTPLMPSSGQQQSLVEKKESTLELVLGNQNLF